MYSSYQKDVGVYFHVITAKDHYDIYMIFVVDLYIQGHGQFFVTSYLRLYSSYRQDLSVFLYITEVKDLDFDVNVIITLRMTLI